MNNGFVKLHRCLKETLIFSDSQAVHLWVYLLLSVNHKPKDVMLSGSKKHIEAGSFICSRNTISLATGINESKIQRLLKALESEQMIEQQMNSKYRMISITNWQKYQTGEQVTEQQMNNKRTADEQQMNTNKNEENEKNEKNEKKKKDDLFLIFKEAHHEYFTGKKRGAATEFEWLKKQHKDWKEIVPILKNCIIAYKKHLAKEKASSGFAPEKHMQGWITDRRWETYVTDNIEPKKMKTLKTHEGETIEVEV